MTTKPTIELKKIDVHVGLSEETPAYTATLWVDGKAFADVKNEGCGGSDAIYFVVGKNWDDYKALQALVAATYPAIKLEGHEPLEADLETICHTLVWEHVDLRNFQSKLSRKVLIVREGNVYELSGKKSDALVKAAVAKYGAANVLNLLPAKEAFKFMK